MRLIGLLLLISVAAFGQRGGGTRSGYNTFGSVSGFGNVVFPGTGHAPPISRAGVGYGGRLGSTAIGVGAGRIHGGRSTAVFVPYAVGFPAYYGQPDEGPAPAMYSAPQQVAPQVVINQNFAPESVRPIVREYVSDSDGGIRVYQPTPRVSAAPEPAEENPTYLIAFKDHTIYAALAYWVEGDILHYVTGQNTHNQVSLDLIDRDLSLRFNRERNVDFRLPPAR